MSLIMCARTKSRTKAGRHRRHGNHAARDSVARRSARIDGLMRWIMLSNMCAMTDVDVHVWTVVLQQS